MEKCFGESARKLLDDADVRRLFFQKIYDYLNELEASSTTCLAAISGIDEDCQKAAEKLQALFKDICRRSENQEISLTDGILPNDPEIHFYLINIMWVRNKKWDHERGYYYTENHPPN